jgi:hypothetical protein
MSQRLSNRIGQKVVTYAVNNKINLKKEYGE